MGTIEKYKKQIAGDKVEYEIRSFRLPSQLLMKLSLLADKTKTTPNDMVKRILESELSEIRLTDSYVEQFKKTRRSTRKRAD